MKVEISQSLLLTVWQAANVYNITGFVLAWFVLNAVYSGFFHPLRRIPGPFPARFTELWRTYKYASGKWHEDILNLHRKYGPVVRISPNEISFVDKDALIKVYGHSTGTKKVAQTGDTSL